MANLYKIIFPFTFVFLSVFFAFSAQAADYEVMGWAWSENIGWVSFNSSNPDSGGGNYGVKLNTISGDFSGYAWSENIGWISFQNADVSHPVAHIDPVNLGITDAPILGWGRALAGCQNDPAVPASSCSGPEAGAATGGWDGWIKFDSSPGYNAYIGASGDFHKWAWGSDVVGWLSLNGSDPGAGGSYNVYIDIINMPPVAEAGSPQYVQTGSTVQLDGSASYDPDNNLPLTYFWQIINKPPGSSANLSNPTSVNPTFVADKDGTYVIQLVVKDSKNDSSAPDSVTIYASSPPVCGNNIKEGTEECDGADSADCPGKCLADCTCPVPWYMRWWEIIPK